jgi:hypothetical protein
MDLAWLPSSLRSTLREILDCGNSQPFRSYYDWVANTALTIACASECSTIVELGAGTAPVTRRMALDLRSEGCRLVVCDKNPDLAEYDRLAAQFPGKVHVITASVDFTVPQQWPANTLLVLSATFHHIPSNDRLSLIRSLSESADSVVVFEPLRKSLLSVLFVFLSTVPALLVPFQFLGRPGTCRRILWCWLAPVAPIMFWWDGVVSCLRQWSTAEWNAAFKRLGVRRNLKQLKCWLFCQQAVW